MFSLKKRRLREDLIPLYNDLKEGCSKVRIELFSQAPSDEMRGNGHKVYHGRLRLGIRRNFFMERIIWHWNRLPREVESPSREVVQTPAHVEGSSVV